MKTWTEIRRRVLVEGVSKRQIIRETGIHWRTLKKILENSEPPGYRKRQETSRPKLGPYLHRIKEILQADRDAELPKKQRHTAKRIFERLQDEGYQGGYTVVKDVVRELKQRSREVFVPLQHRPGEAQVDFGYALVKMAGPLRKVAFFVMSLPYSDAVFVMACERECTETFWEGHVRAFRFFQGVPYRISYDNSKVMVSKIVGAHKRGLTYGFLQLQSHYLFQEHFCCVRRPNEKGVVEGCVKYTRLNFFVPVPQVQDFHELNERLEAFCRKDQKRRLRGKTGRKEELLQEEQSAFLSLPPSPFDACRKVSTTASSLSLVRFETNDYSVPVKFAHHPIVAKGYMDRVVLCFLGKEIAVHSRLWCKEQVSLHPIHYLALLERKPGALDYALPLENWKLPACFPVLRRGLEHERGVGEGTREYIRVLRLLEKRSVEELTQAVEKALRVGGFSHDVVAQYLYGEEWKKQGKFSLDGREHLKYVQVDSPDLSAYQDMLKGGKK